MVVSDSIKQQKGKSISLPAYLSGKLLTARPILLFVPLYLVWFAAIEQIPSYLCYNVADLIDRMIPFIKCFIVPYYIWFLFIPFVGVYLLFEDELTFKKFQTSFIAGMLLFLIFNTFFTTSINIRPVVVYGSDIFSVLIRGLYEIDTPTNVFPSMHVFTTVIALVAMLRAKRGLRHNVLGKVSLITLSVLIILSTMFLKQHAVVDVIGGILLGAVCWLMQEVPVFAKNSLIEKVLNV